MGEYLRIESMGSNYKRLFQALPPVAVPEYLGERIHQAVLRERERREHVRLAVSSLSGAGSLVGLAFALPALLNAAVATGFSTFASLVISDTSLVAGNFNAFVLSLLSAVPGLEVTATLFFTAAFLVSLKTLLEGLSRPRDITIHQTYA
jgi:hypothetical protein